tara:strand:- start:75 stop:575 length:501 start_codon:yes stop_codon:yes gene_type:complete
MSKTKELLENLNKIVKKPSQYENQKVISYTNRYYEVPGVNHKLPAHYDKAKKHKDEEGEEYIMIDRIYGSIFSGGSNLLQADGTYYYGKVVKKRRLIKSKDPITKEDKSFYSPCSVTADGRWFDNAGLPIEPPKKLEPEKKPDPEDIEEEKRQAKEREARILANLK